MKTRSKRIFGIFVLGITLLFLSCIVLEQVAHARAGGGRSSGSRSYSTGTRSTTGGTYNSPSRSTNPTTQPGAQPSSQFSPGKSLLYGIGGGLVGGMIGNMLFGRSGFAGMGGAGGGGFGFGDLIIILIIVGIIYFVYKRYKAKKEMQMSAASPAGYGSYAYNEPAYNNSYDAPYNAQPAQGDPVQDGLKHIAAMDPTFSEKAFCDQAEDLFFKIQGGWTRRDMGAISNLLTPQMRDTFQADISRYIADKKINRLENIAVRQVEIVEAIQDQGQEYLTIRYTASLLDFITDDAGNMLSGSSTDPVKFLEYWTYSRKVGERAWRLAAITQEQDYR
ncbi:MAG: Tim44 domain-containing protein [Syntrophorhabdaceae bacterium]